jgi:protein-S-isoprenylcysteine O-methyltransferase Ste14
MAWFSAMFFVALPWLVLTQTGADPREAWRASGALALAVALVLVTWLIVFFVREGRGTPAPFDPPRRFVSRGAYRWSRNPMYLGYVVVILAEALAFRSAALVAYAAVFLALAHAFVVGVEEPSLRRRFGAAYEAYCREVPRWLPLNARR